MSNKSTSKLAIPLLDLISRQQSQSDEPCFVALDGRSGAGKSTLATYVANRLPSVTVIEGDDFYTGGSFDLWKSRTISENAQYCIDWKIQHELISTLKTDGIARWHAFDWTSKIWDSANAPYRAALTTCHLTDVVLLEGVYSARAELSDLFDFRVVLRVSENNRKNNLIAREGKDFLVEWQKVWSDAEEHYFDYELDQQSVNLILS